MSPLSVVWAFTNLCANATKEAQEWYKHSE